MSALPLVSVIIPTYNCAAWIAQAIESVFAQTYTNLEVIVVDDGSTDDTRARLTPWDGRIRYIVQANGGPAKARNRGIKEARGALIAFLDADDLWLPEKLMRQWECLQQSADIGLVHTDTYHKYEPSAECVYLHRSRERFVNMCYPEFFLGNRVHTSTVLVTRTGLDRAGLFDESIRVPSTEDLDLWIRIAKDFAFGYVNESLVVYRHHNTNGSLDQLAMVQNEYRVLARAFGQDRRPSGSIPIDKITHRLFELAVLAGCCSLDAGSPATARSYFAAALSHKRASARTVALWLSTFLPRGTRSLFRRAKHIVSAPSA